jgi:hypothetical protein
MQKKKKKKKKNVPVAAICAASGPSGPRQKSLDAAAAASARAALGGVLCLSVTLLGRSLRVFVRARAGRCAGHGANHSPDLSFSVQAAVLARAASASA